MTAPPRQATQPPTAPGEPRPGPGRDDLHGHDGVHGPDGVQVREILPTRAPEGVPEGVLAEAPGTTRGPRRFRAAAARHFGGLPGPFWVVFSGTVINRVGTMVVPFLVFYLGSRGVNADQTPYVLGALGAGGLVGPVLGGWFADRLGRRQAILTGMVATPISQALLFASPGFVTLAVAAALLGAAANLHLPGVAAVIADSSGASRRRAAYGLYHWAINIGAAIAGALGGFLIAHGFWLLFVVDAVTCLGFAAVAAAALPKDAPRHANGPTGSGGYGLVLRDRMMLALVVVSVAGECVYAQTEFTVPLAIRDHGLPASVYGLVAVVNALTEFTVPLAIRDHGLPASVYGLVAVVNALLVVVCQPFANTWLARRDRLRVWAAASVLLAVGVGLTGTAHSAGGFVATAVVWSAGEVCAGGISTAVVADLAPVHARARYQAALNWARGVARFLALVAGPALYATAGPAALWWAVAALGMAGSFGVLALRPGMARAEHRAKASA